MESIKESNMKISVKCPLCEKQDVLTIPIKEILKAREELTLITKAIIHEKDKHVLTVYIDGYGRVRRKYTFNCIDNLLKSSKKDNFPGSLNEIFDLMKKNSLEME